MSVYGLNDARGANAFKHTSRFVVGEEASGHSDVRWEVSRAMSDELETNTIREAVPFK